MERRAVKQDFTEENIGNLIKDSKNKGDKQPSVRSSNRSVKSKKSKPAWAISDQ